MNKDIEILRNLARELAEVAAQPEQTEKRRLWEKLNGLKPERPMLVIDDIFICWHELNIEDALTLRCEDHYFREIETQLRRLLYRNRYLKDDFVFEAAIYLPSTVRGLDFGLAVEEDTINLNEDKDAIKAHHYYDQLKTEEDLEKLKVPDFRVDEEETKKHKEMAEEAVGDYLEVVMDGVEIGHDAWDLLVQWRGFDNLLEDICDNPEFVYQTIEKSVDIKLAILDKLEEKNLLRKRPQRLVGSITTFTDELPKTEDADLMHPKACDSFTYGMAQIMYLMSPEMYNELEITFAKKWFSRFGMGYYGCCEPLDDRLEYVKQIPNVRKISASGFVKNYERFAEELEGKYVMSFKPSPAMLVDGAWNPERVRTELQKLLHAADRHKAPCEFILKDLSTISSKPKRLFEWVGIANEVLQR